MGEHFRVGCRPGMSTSGAAAERAQCQPGGRREACTPTHLTSSSGMSAKEKPSFQVCTVSCAAGSTSVCTPDCARAAARGQVQER